MAMIALPSFQTFLQNSATTKPSSPLWTNDPGLQSPTCALFDLDQTSGMQQAYSQKCRFKRSSSAAFDVNIPNETFQRLQPSLGLVATQISPFTTCGGAAGKRVKKKYLKERERCEIVRRVREGEKQAHLAKEFGVSRAAVCYLLKHQMEIMHRSAQRL